MKDYEGGHIMMVHARPSTPAERFGCLGIIIAVLIFWGAYSCGVYSYGRYVGERTGCKTEAEVIAALKALPHEAPSIEVVP